MTSEFRKNRTAPGDNEIYGAEYYASHLGPFKYDRSHPHWGVFFGAIADELIRTFRPRRVFDAGCALGFLVEALWDRGVEAWGRDISDYAIKKVRADMRSYCSVGSLADPIEGRYDLVTCIEVLEHMTDADGAKAIGNMVAVTDRVVISTSPDDFAEPTHINVRPPIYWMRAFAEHGFVPLCEVTLPSITPYTLVLERRDERPSDDYLLACAGLISARMKMNRDDHELGRIPALSAERDAALSEKSNALAERDAALSEKSNALAERDAALAERKSALAERDAAIAERDEARSELHAVVSSTTWRASRPIRSLGQYLPTRARIWLRAVLRRGYRLARGARPVTVVEARPADQQGFDPVYYLRENKDVLAAGIDPLQHYLQSGRSEGRFPNAAAYREVMVLHLRDLCDPVADEPGARVFDDRFTVSVITPTYNTDPRYLRELLQSLRNQRYGNWEWIVVDDGSSDPGTIATLRVLSAVDDRVRVRIGETNIGIAGASNAALTLAEGSHAALIDHDDLVSRDAFLAIYEAWKVAPETQLFYTDECKLMPDGRLENFWPKPDWSPAYLENTMCIGHLSVYRIDFLRDVGGFRSQYDGTQDYDLALRASLKGPSVIHLPIFAYIWRVIPGSAALDLSEKNYAVERQGRALLEYARHKHPDATVVPGWGAGYWRIVYPMPTPAPLLSYVIPTGGVSRSVRGNKLDLILNCVRSFEEKAFYPNREYIIVHNDNLTAEQVRELRLVPNTRLVHYESAVFNFSEKLNLGVSVARGEYVCLLNDDVEAITTRGGEELVSYLAANPTVGCIGPKCLRENETIQQNGVVLLEAVGPAHAGDGQHRYFGGHQSMLRCRREAYCIGGAILIIKKELYDALGGFDENLPLNYNDVDFGLRLRELGYGCVIDPGVEVYHFEGATKVGTGTVEQERFFLKHPGMRDPYFSRWFDAGDPNYRLKLKNGDHRFAFGSWLDRHIAVRAQTLVPEGRHKLSVCVSVYNQSKRLLEEMYKSVVMQTYTNAELVIVDNGSANKETLEWLDYARRERRCQIVRTDVNIGISGANRLLLDAMAGEYFVAVDADDFLSVDALQVLASAIEASPGKKIFYTDEYKSDMHSTRFGPFFKPDFDPVLLMNCCYPAHLMAIEASFLREIGSYTDDRATWCHDYDTLTRALERGEEPIHVRELTYAWRINPGSTASAETGTKPGTVESQRFVLERLITARGLNSILAVEPNRIESSSGMWRLQARHAVQNVQVLSAAGVWGAEGLGVAGLIDKVRDPAVDWVAVLLDPADGDALLELSAIAHFDPRVVAVSGLLLADDRTLRWSGGVFLPNGQVLDPYFKRPLAEGGDHGRLWCQRCVDVAAPVNVLIRASALRDVPRRGDVRNADELMVVIGLQAHEQSQFVAVTPHLLATQPPASLVPVPLDRSGILAKSAVSKAGSRWYDGRLEYDRPYKMPRLA
ncbi:GT2 family glycosyltransferase/SAM-dependent methyltransferase [Bradyrhizobium sp. JR7.2]|uniref:glycosyltransferase n=1 Tax=Bradyrhizobium sp. JR7.2 TaxID=3156375 RepID=UPI0033966285